MRVAVSVLAAVLLVAGLIVVRANGRETTAGKQSARQYIVDCRLVSEEPPKKNWRGRVISQPLDFKVPPVIARDGEKASIEDLGQESFSVARLPQGEVTRTVAEGTRLEMVVTGVADDKAILDITAELSSSQATPGENGESVCLSFAKLRGIECVKLGQKAVFRASPSERWRLEATVRAAQE